MNTKFNPGAGERIDKSTFDAMKSAFQRQFEGATEANYFGRHCFEALLTLPGCVGIRTFHGLNDEGEIKQMSIAIDIDNNPIADQSGNVVIYEVGQPCPPGCNF